MRRSFIVLVALATVLPFALGGSAPATAKALTPGNRFAPSGTVSSDPNAAPANNAAAVAQARTRTTATSALAPSANSGGCSDVSGSNVRVNQECTNVSQTLGRSQSQNETAIAVNPTNTNNILASQNDYRDGDGHCGVDASLDGGQHWGSRLAPEIFTLPGFTAPRHYWDAGGDTSVAFDTTGEAYLMCQVFDRGATSDKGGDASGFLLFRSNDGGYSWSFAGSPTKLSDGTGADGIGLLDKQYMVIDTNPSSPHVNRIYVVWANYSTDFLSSPIYLATSDDYGNTWTQRGAISGSSGALCPVSFARPEDEGDGGGDTATVGSPCDASQFANPFIAPNGDFYTAFVNFNNCAGGLRALGFDCPGDANDNHNQILIVKSTDGGASFTPPVKVSDYYDLPDCYTYTGYDFGRACVPTAPISGRSIFRATNYPSGTAISSTQIVVDFGSYINVHSNPTKGNCAPNGLNADTFLNKYTGVGVVNGCNNDILRSISNNGGASFTGTSTPPWKLNSIVQERPTLADQWWQWTATNPVTHHAVATFYDRQYNGDQAGGLNDITLRRGDGSFVQVTTAHGQPTNEFPDANGGGLFMGDYIGLAIGSDGIAHPIWADTRNPIYTFSLTGDPRQLILAGYGADIYTASLSAG